jgi:acyl-CoA hydrolase
MRIAQTRIETIQYVMPEHANPLGNLFGGKMMHWMTTAGTLSASRLARGPVVLGSMDDIDFLSPAHVGEVVVLSSCVAWTGTSSMEVSIEVQSENPRTAESRSTTRAHMAYVAIDDHGRPRPLPSQVHPEGQTEEALWAEAAVRKAARLQRMAERRARLAGGDEPCAAVTHRLESWRIVFPENAISAGIMFAGDLMAQIDEVAGVLAQRHARNTVVTAAIDAMDFFDPVRVGHLLHLRAGLNLVGRTSMEVGVRVEAEDGTSGRHHHTCSAYLTFVALDAAGRPTPVPPFEPASDEEQRRRDSARRRRALRHRRIEHRSPERRG